MLKKKASAPSREPSTGKQKQRSSVSTCLESVVKHKARVFDTSKNETRNYVGTYVFSGIASFPLINRTYHYHHLISV